MPRTRITPDQDAVVSEVEIAAPPERVFQALINREQALTWGTSDAFTMKVWEMDPRPGGEWTFVSVEKGSGREYEHHGEIVEIDPPRVLAYTWFANWHPKPSHPTMVRWKLTAIPTGTHLEVTHSGLAQQPGACAGYSQGWPGLVEALKKFVEQ
jgi:uncharacterized protein YndB with AHSA1/START domain